MDCRSGHRIRVGHRLQLRQPSTIESDIPSRATQNEKGLPFLEALLIGGAAGRIRTHDPLVRSQVLYPTELQPQPRKEII